jgi:hypothetical protein
LFHFVKFSNRYDLQHSQEFTKPTLRGTKSNQVTMNLHNRNLLPSLNNPIALLKKPSRHVQSMIGFVIVQRRAFRSMVVSIDLTSNYKAVPTPPKTTLRAFGSEYQVNLLGLIRQHWQRWLTLTNSRFLIEVYPKSVATQVQPCHKWIDRDPSYRIDTIEWC